MRCPAEQVPTTPSSGGGGTAVPYATTLVVHVDEPDLVPDRRVPGESARLLAQVKVAVFDRARGEHADPGQVALLIALDLAEHRRERMVAAVRDALTAMPSGVSFAVVTAGGGRGEGPVRYYPAGPGSWAPADRRHRVNAAFAMGAAPLAADGAPRSFGYDGWLAEARRLFAGCDRPLCRLLLVTDGSTGYEDASLAAQLAACGAEFTCDVIAVGKHWDYRPLERIVGRLRGTADDAGPDFAAALAAAVRRACRRACRRARAAAGGHRTPRCERRVPCPAHARAPRTRRRPAVRTVPSRVPHPAVGSDGRRRRVPPRPARGRHRRPARRGTPVRHGVAGVPA
ncbi:hypothetical protein [Streptomyces tailanensis]|uniref:hypothetical protein n=1 Tax=Streptomyces tailanensis TaxID=2569858 RepID=UPI00122E3F04|nr:hypothetical protein [Streptomyces tailanensis]